MPENYEDSLRADVRYVVNKLPVHLDTSSDMEEAIYLISELIRKREKAALSPAPHS